MKATTLIPGKRGLVIAAGILAGLVVLYALAGFLLAPWLAKREIPRRAAEAGAQARVAEIAFNPFTLRLSVSGLAVEERSGAPLLGLGAGQADIDWRPLLRGDLAFSEVRLQEPVIHVRISEQGELNLAVLGRTGAAGGAKGRPPAIALESVAVENGRISFEDRRQGYRNSFENLSLELASISTTPNDTGRYELAARTADGSRLSWQGEASLAPLSLTGKLVLEHGNLPQFNPYLQPHSALRIASGSARVSLAHRFTLAEGKLSLLVEDASVSVEQLALALKGAEAPFATIGRLGLEGLEADWQARRAAARALTIGDFSLEAGRDQDGALYPRGFATGPENDQGGAWAFDLASLTLADGTVSFADAANALAWKLERVAARVQSLSSDASRPVAFELEASVAGGGRLAANGKATPGAGTLQARIEASAVPLAPIEGLLARHANIKLLSGSLALSGDLTMGGEAGTRRDRSARLAYNGAASLDNVAIQDGAGAPLVQWKALATPALRLTLAPNVARIDELRWTAPKGRLEISADGTTNLGRAFRGGGKASESRKPAPASREAPPGATATPDEGERPDEVGDFPIRIRRVRVEGGSLDFADRSLSPNFSTLIHALTGTVSGISTDRNTRSQIALEGQVNEYGHARLTGSLNAFAPEERTTFRVQLRNLEVARLSPYTIKFAGYRVASGRMSLDLNYRVNESRLQGDNKIVLDDFTLGERVAESDSPVPLELAVALLKDADGRIDLAVPISGSLDDPNFSFSEIIWKAIGNIVRNVVAAPFRALGRLFGAGSETLAAISFEPGADRLLPPEREKLKRIADGLARRADLKVVVPARYDAEADAVALKRAALRQEIGRRAGLDPGEGDATAPVNIADRRTRNAVRGLFAERFGDEALERQKDEAEREAAGDGKAPDLSLIDRFRKFAGGEPRVADARGFYRSLFRRMLETQSLPEGALSGLAQRRAAAIAEGLRAAGVDPARVELSSAEPTADAQAREVTVALSLAPVR